MRLRTLLNLPLLFPINSPNSSAIRSLASSAKRRASALTHTTNHWVSHSIKSLCRLPPQRPSPSPFHSASCVRALRAAQLPFSARARLILRIVCLHSRAFTFPAAWAAPSRLHHNERATWNAPSIAWTPGLYNDCIIPFLRAGLKGRADATIHWAASQPPPPLASSRS